MTKGRSKMKYFISVILIASGSYLAFLCYDGVLQGGYAMSAAFVFISLIGSGLRILIEKAEN